MPALERALHHPVLRHHVDHPSIPAQGIPVLGIQQRLRDGLKELLRPQPRLPQRLAHPVELVRGGARHHKVLGKVDAANRVKGADEGGVRACVDAGHDGRCEVGPKALLIQARADQIRQHLRLDLALLPQPVHVDAEAEELAEAYDVGGETGQAEEDVAIGEDLGEVGGDSERLQAQAQVARDGHAVLAHHGDAGAAIDFKGVGHGSSSRTRSG